MKQPPQQPRLPWGAPPPLPAGSTPPPPRLAARHVEHARAQEAELRTRVSSRGPLGYHGGGAGAGPWIETGART